MARHHGMRTFLRGLDECSEVPQLQVDAVEQVQHDFGEAVAKVAAFVHHLGQHLVLVLEQLLSKLEQVAFEFLSVIHDVLLAQAQVVLHFSDFTQLLLYLPDFPLHQPHVVVVVRLPSIVL